MILLRNELCSMYGSKMIKEYIRMIAPEEMSNSATASMVATLRLQKLILIDVLSTFENDASPKFKLQIRRAISIALMRALDVNQNNVREKEIEWLLGLQGIQNDESKCNPDFGVAGRKNSDDWFDDG